MNVTSDIAQRYLIGKKSTSAINWITLVVIIGLSIGTAAMIISMSVFNGFEQLLSGLFNAYNPDLKVIPKEGLYINTGEETMARIRAIDGVAGVSKTLQETVLFEYDGAQEAAYIKGVDKNFQEVIDIDSTIVSGEFLLEQDNINYGVLGIGIFNKLAVNPGDPLTPITVYMARLKNRGPLDKDYKSLIMYPKGVFSVGNDDDTQVVLADYDYVARLLEVEDVSSALEIKLTDKDKEDEVRKELQKVIATPLTIKNRYQQDEAYLKIMNIEKWVTFLLVALTILILSFNLVGSLWMIVLDKRKDISTLRFMGLESGAVYQIFMKLGVMIGLVGLCIGVVLALFFYALQKKFGIISVPPGFMIESYPIELKWTDFLITAATVLLISFLASLLPSIKAKSIGSYVRHE